MTLALLAFATTSTAKMSTKTAYIFTANHPEQTASYEGIKYFCVQSISDSPKYYWAEGMPNITPPPPGLALVKGISLSDTTPPKASPAPCTLSGTEIYNTTNLLSKDYTLGPAAGWSTTGTSQ